MLTRLLVLALLLVQCASPTKTTKTQLPDTSATYMKYIPGAGGGKGILFKIDIKNSPEILSIDRLVINNIEVPANLDRRIINASVFYADTEPTMDNPNPEATDPVLFNQENFEAVVYYSNNGRQDSIKVTNFSEIEQPLYP